MLAILPASWRHIGDGRLHVISLIAEATNAGARLTLHLIVLVRSSRRVAYSEELVVYSSALSLERADEIVQATLFPLMATRACCSFVRNGIRD